MTTPRPIFSKLEALGERPYSARGKYMVNTDQDITDAQGSLF
jgi:hypothetical protein